MAQTWMVVSGIIAIMVGIIMIIIGVVMYESNLRNRKTQPAYVYILIGGGIVIGVIGGILLGVGLVMRRSGYAYYDSYGIERQYPPDLGYNSPRMGYGPPGDYPFPHEHTYIHGGSLTPEHL